VTIQFDLEFTEEMKGWFGFGETEFHQGYIRGRDQGNALMVHLTIETEDVYRFIRDRDHLASARGWVQADVLGGRSPIEDATFNLFVDDGPKRRRMLYRLFFFDGVGHPLTLSGFKDVNVGPITDAWAETSTLYTSLRSGHVNAADERSAPLVGAGILHILPLDFARQLTTFRVYGPGFVARLVALAAFGEFFAAQLWRVFKPSAWRPRRA
jgi:cholesterol oxidase